ncbi:MAG: gamma-butyrobetaine dioxygenase [Granulosicoccus sp.]
MSLEPFAMAGGWAPDLAALPCRLCTSGHYPGITRISMDDILSCRLSCTHFAGALIEEGVVLVTAIDNSDSALTKRAETFGPVTPRVDGSYFDVRLTINPTNLAYSAQALEMHTDLPNEEAAPGVQFLHCRANSVEGGLSLFVDGAAVVEALREERACDFALL